MENPEFLVRVDCLTYNHSLYITDAMNGFCMQNTSFPYICTILDDASIDGEQEVITQYLRDNFTILESNQNSETEAFRQVMAQHITNRNCFFRVVFLKYNHYQLKKRKQPYFDTIESVKYIAMCEGDDFWINADKLQKQVSFLEAHPNHSLCYHAYRKDSYINDAFSSKEIHCFNGDMIIVPDDVVLKGVGMLAATASMMFRKTDYDDYPEWARKAPIGDKPLQLVLFSRGYLGYLDDVMSVYRVGSPGSWTKRMRQSRKYRRGTKKGIIELYKDFDKWTEGKYHNSIRKGLKRFRVALFKREVRLLLHRPYHFFLSLLGRRS